MNFAKQNNGYRLLWLLALALGLMACGGEKTPANEFRLSLSRSSLDMSPGKQETVTVTLENLTGSATLRLEGQPEGMTASFAVNPVTSDSTALSLLVNAEVEAKTYPLTVVAEAGGKESRASLTVQVVKTNSTVKPAENPSGISLRLDKVVYADGESLTLTLDFNDVIPPADVLDVMLSAPDSSDVEQVALVKASGGTYVSAKPLQLSQFSGTATPLDDVLSLQAGETLFAFYYLDKAQASLASLEEDLIMDFALFAYDEEDLAATTVEPELALSEDEKNPASGAKPVGTILPENGLPVQIATEELIFYPEDEAQLQQFLAETSGEVVGKQEMVGDDPDEQNLQLAYLISIDPAQAQQDALPHLRAFYGEDSDLFASKEDALAIYNLALYYQLEGYIVAVNPRLQLQGAPSLDNTEASAVTHTMKLTPSGCMPGDPNNPCVENVPAMWAFMALADYDDSRINLAVLDMGFATNDDFRQPESGSLIECDMTSAGAFSSDVTCKPGSAQGSPTVGNSFFGNRSWHGTGVVTTAGGVVHNNFGAAGTGGQVVVPMLYKYDAQAYAFEFGLGIRLATDAGASCINISAGYPCTILTNVGPDFDICSASGRAAICAEVFAAATVATGVVCLVGSFIPVIGPIACAVAVGGTVAGVTACIGTLAFGDLKGPIASGVKYAAHRGVPVVTISGNVINKENLPPVIRDLVTTDDNRTERWGLVPAMIPETIVVGAVDSSLDNVEFFGERVDIWAPISSAYVAPSDINNPASSVVAQSPLGGTSAAAPFIAGVIANMQAVNPQLNPNTPNLVNPQQIVNRIKRILLDDANSFSNSELVAMGLGYSDQPEERRKLVDPLAVVQAAAKDIDQLVDLDALGYDTSLNFLEGPGAAQDTLATAEVVDVSKSYGGTVVSLDPDPAGSDFDWFRLTMPVAPGRIFESKARLRYPKRYGRPSLTHDTSLNPDTRFISRGGSSLNDNEFEDIYSIFAPSGSNAHVAVTGRGKDDNVYKLTFDTPEPAQPKVQISRPTTDPDLEVCADNAVFFRAEASYEQSSLTSFTVPPNTLVWHVDGGQVGSGETVTEVFAAGQHEVEVRAFDDANASDSLSINAITCTNAPPTAVIVTPDGDVKIVVDGVEGELEYIDITLVAKATDPEDGDLSGSSLVWKTDRSDVQDSLLGTGQTLSTRLYTENACFGDNVHVIQLETRDGDGNPSLPALRTITIISDQPCIE